MTHEPFQVAQLQKEQRERDRHEMEAAAAARAEEAEIGVTERDGEQKVTQGGLQELEVVLESSKSFYEGFGRARTLTWCL